MARCCRRAQLWRIVKGHEQQGAKTRAATARRSLRTFVPACVQVRQLANQVVSQIATKQLQILPHSDMTATVVPSAAYSGWLPVTVSTASAHVARSQVPVSEGAGCTHAVVCEQAPPEGSCRALQAAPPSASERFTHASQSLASPGTQVQPSAAFSSVHLHTVQAQTWQVAGAAEAQVRPAAPASGQFR